MAVGRGRHSTAWGGGTGRSTCLSSRQNSLGSTEGLTGVLMPPCSSLAGVTNGASGMCCYAGLVREQEPIRHDFTLKRLPSHLESFQHRPATVDKYFSFEQ